LSGKVNGEERTLRFPEQVFDDATPLGSATLGAIPRLWATRKIGSLLNQIRLEGANQEIIDQIVRLSIRYGIVTPYTSYLVTEEAPLGAAVQDRIASEEFNALQAAPAEPVFGRGAVEKATGMGGMAGADAAAAPSVEVVDTVRVIGSRAYVNDKGVWTDTAYDPEKMRTLKVAFLSADYFALAASNAELAAAFALGDRVIAFGGGVAYEVVAEGTVTPPVEIPNTPTAEPTAQPASDPTRPASLPASPTPAAAPDQTAPGMLPCASPLLIGLLPLGLLWARRRFTRQS
jgi:Ca-activated chloride channel family protein